MKETIICKRDYTSIDPTDCRHPLRGVARWVQWLVTCVLWLFYMCHDLLAAKCVPWLIDIWRDSSMHSMTLYVCHDSLTCVPWLHDTCGMTHWYVWHDSLICVPWLIDMCAMAYWYVCHDLLICVPWLHDMWRNSCMCATTVCVCYDSLIREMKSHSNGWKGRQEGQQGVWHDSLICAMTHWYEDDVCYHSLIWICCSSPLAPLQPHKRGITHTRVWRDLFL